MSELETQVKSLYGDLEPSPQVRADVLALLDEEPDVSRPRLVLWGSLAAAAAVLLAFLIATPRDDTADVPTANVPASESIVEERTANLAAYARHKAKLHAEHAGEWVVIAGGRLACVADTFDNAVSEEAPGAHRFVFQVGTEGDQSTFISTWYAPRFAGPALAKALDIDWQSGANGFEAWREGGARVKSFTSGPFPRVRLPMGVPGSPMSSRELFIGTTGPALVLTDSDYRTMGLARFEVPGTLTMMDIPCTRVVVQVSLAEGEPRRPVVAAVSRAWDQTMIHLARGRHEFWHWGGSLAAQATAPHNSGWIVFANDRVLGHGATKEAAVRASKGATDYAAHRYLLKLPYKAQVLPLREESTAEVREMKFRTISGHVASCSIDTMLVHDDLPGPIAVVEEAVANEMLRLHELEVPAGLVTAEKGKPVRAGYVWQVIGGEDRLVLVGQILHHVKGSLESLSRTKLVTARWEDSSYGDVIALLQVLTGLRIEHVGKPVPSSFSLTYQADQVPLMTIFGHLADKIPGFSWQERQDGLILVGQPGKWKGKRGR